MSKQEMLIEYNIQEIIDYISNDKGIDYDEAMRQFYSSKVFEKLNDIDIGLYLESPIGVLEGPRSDKETQG